MKPKATETFTMEKAIKPIAAVCGAGMVISTALTLG